jgi:hypothetical protein
VLFSFKEKKAHIKKERAKKEREKEERGRIERERDRGKDRTKERVLHLSLNNSKNAAIYGGPAWAIHCGPKFGNTVSFVF